MSTGENVQSVERALDIIEVLAVEPEGLGVTEIAGRIHLHKSTVHRLISTLTARGYLEKTDAGNYKVGIKLIGAVSCYINSLELQTEARPYLAKITGALNLTAHLGVLDGNQVVYIEKMDVVSSIKLYSQIGLHVHAYCSSLGKCLLSNYSKEDLENRMANCSFIKFTAKTISSMEEFHEEMKKVRAQGWAMDDEESETGHRCIGAPIYDYRGDIIASISASGPTALLTRERIPQVVDYLKDAAAQLSRDMGYNG